MWVFLDGHKYTPTGTPNKMVHAAGEIYVTLSGKQVGVYHFFGQELPVGQENYNERLIDLSSYFVLDPYYICSGPNCVYVFEKGYGVLNENNETTTVNHDEEFIRSFVKISTITHEVVQHVKLPQEAHCYPTYARFKLWFTTPASIEITDSGRQSLFYYDTTTDSWSNFIEIPGKKQFRPHKICHGKQSFIFVDLFNDNSVVKFNDSDGSFVSQIIFNRKPKHMVANGNRELLVASYNGMVTNIDQVTDAYTNSYSTMNETEWFEDDGDYIWSVIPELARTKKSSGVDNFLRMKFNYRCTKDNGPATPVEPNVTSGWEDYWDISRPNVPLYDPYENTKSYSVTGSPGVTLVEDGDRDYIIEGFSEREFNQVIIVPGFTRYHWDTSLETISEVTQEQFIVVLSDNKLWMATTFRDSWTLEEERDYHLDVNVTSIVATGPEAYYGETL